MAELLEPGFYELELGDVIHAWAYPSGSVVSAGGVLVILWDDGIWVLAEHFESHQSANDAPYQVERREWDLDVEAIHDACLWDALEQDFGPEGTDLEPRVA